MKKLNKFELLYILSIVALVTGLVLAVLQFRLSGADSLAIGIIISSLLALGAIVINLFTQRKQLFRPLNVLRRGGEIILNTHAAHELEMPEAHALGNLPEIVHQLGDEIMRSRHEISRALQTGAQSADLKKIYLEQVIRCQDEGIIVCNHHHRIILYNPAALRVTGGHTSLGLGRFLSDLLPKPVLENTIDHMNIHKAGEEKQNNPSSEFVCSIQDSDHLLLCKMTLLTSTADTSHSHGYVLTLSDITSKQFILGKRNKIMRSSIDNMRSPLANLRAAAENLNYFADIPDDLRQKFYAVIAEESTNLSLQVDELAQVSRELVGGEFILTDVYSSDLVNNVIRRANSEERIQVIQTGLPIWLRLDSHAVTILLLFFIKQIQLLTRAEKFDLEAQQIDNRAYLQISWEGLPISDTKLNNWLDVSLADVVGFPSVQSVLDQHHSVLWSQTSPRDKSQALFRISVPISRQDRSAVVEYIPSRPISYDFDIMDMTGDDETIMQRRLRDLEYVVFDTETTGLNVEKGDKIISVAGVRIVNQRILSNETFDQLVNPQRKIPRESIRYHGITDDHVSNAPTIDIVLRKFKEFAGDAVLVAHNAWFDMRFIRQQERQSGIKFNNTVLDTLMLSVCLHGHEVEQSLDAILDRLGIEVMNRHTAMSDSMATAQLLLSLIDLLEPKGIITLQDALNAYS